MALKFTLTKDEHAALEDDQKSLYKEVDGKFRLDVDGVPDVSEFRRNNIELMRAVSEKDTLIGSLQAENTTLKTRFEGIDPDEARRTKEEIKAKSGKDDGKFADALNAALAPVLSQVKTLTDTVTQREKDAKDARDREIRVRKEARTRDLASLHKVKDNPLYRGMVVREADEMFDYDPDADVLRPKRKNEEGLDITPERWFQSLRQSAPEMFGDTRGPAMTQDGSVTGIINVDGKRILRNPSPMEMSEYAADIAVGKVVVERT